MPKSHFLLRGSFFGGAAPDAPFPRFITASGVSWATRVYWAGWILTLCLGALCFAPHIIGGPWWPTFRDPGGPGGGAAALRRRLRDEALEALAAQYAEGEEIEQVWISESVSWSFIFAALGAYVAFTTTMYMKQVRSTAWYWLLLVQAGLALGGCTVWCMHFIGMHALTLQTEGKDEVHITFEPVLTFASGLAAWLIATISLHISLGCSRRSGKQFGAQEILCGNDLEPMQLRFWVALLHGMPLVRLGVGSCIIASGVVVMHYMGVLSQCGAFRMEFHGGIVTLSVLIAGVASFAGLGIFFSINDKMLWRVAASCVISVAVNGMHYCGMASVHYFFTPSGGYFGPDAGIRIHVKDVMIVALVCNFVLMAFTGYYIEVVRAFVSSEQQEMAKRLEHEGFSKSVKGLIKRSRTMRFPMCMLRYDTFIRAGRLVPHEDLRDTHKLVYVNTTSDAARMRKKRFIVFFSHQWLSQTMPDPCNRQFQDMCSALERLSKIFPVKLEKMYIWVDYSSIPQHSIDQQQLAIDSLPMYVSACSAFVMVAPQTFHQTTHVPCNYNTYASRFWCRLEVFCTILSSLRVRTSAMSQTDTMGPRRSIITEEGEEADDAEVLAEGGVGEPPGAPVPRPAQPAGPAEGVTFDQHRVFIMLDDSLRRLSFFTQDGQMRREYQDLLLLFDADSTCCECGHVSATGEEIPCDKHRVVDTLVGCYGAMLLDLHKLKRQAKKDERQLLRSRLVEQIVKRRGEVFPERFFGTRMLAVHEQAQALLSQKEQRPLSSSPSGCSFHHAPEGGNTPGGDDLGSESEDEEAENDWMETDSTPTEPSGSLHGSRAPSKAEAISAV